MKRRLLPSLFISLFVLATQAEAQQSGSDQTKTTKPAAVEGQSAEGTKKPQAQTQTTEKAPASDHKGNVNNKKPAEDVKLPAAAEKNQNAPATDSQSAESAEPGTQATPQPGAQPAAQSANIIETPETKAGQAKTGTCTACHNADGNSTVPNWPKIAGQYEDYLVKQLKEYRMGDKGPRFEASMYAMVANLTDQDIADLAAFYSHQKQTMGKANAQYVSLGEKIYRGGNIQTGVTACLACHGPDGQGNEAAKFPRLAGQHATYIENQLRAFKDGKRKNSPNGMMESISRSMSDEEMKAVSSYVEGLR